MAETLPTKPWYASEAIWGGVAAVGGGLGTAWYGFQLKSPEIITTGLGAAMGGIMAIIGRFKATTIVS